MSTKVLFIGNCQARAIEEILNLDPDFFSTSRIDIHLPYDQEKSKYLINTADIIISQRIRDVYGIASSKSVLNNKKNTSKIIFYNSCYMKLYYFDSKYYLIDEKILDQPYSYHYQSIIDCYKMGLSSKECDDQYIQNQSLVSKEVLYSYLENDIEQLSKRYNNLIEISSSNNNVYLIDIRQFILDNFKNKLLFYSFNHPSYILLQYIVENIKIKLGINTNICLDKDPLNETQCLLYKCLVNILDIDIPKYQKNDTLNIIKQYYNIYNTLKKI